MKLNDLDRCILDMITSVQSKHQGLIDSSITIHKGCDMSRSFRCKSNSETLHRGVKGALNDRNNRWRKDRIVEASRAKLRM